MQPQPDTLGKSLDRLTLNSTFWYPPDEGDPASRKNDASGDELDMPGSTDVAPSAKLKWKSGPVGTYQMLTHLLLKPNLWLYALLFASVQVLCWAYTGESFFGTLTGSVVESVRLPTTGRVALWHMLSASAMWALGAVQFLLKRFRHGRLAWVHRSLGRAFLALWFLGAGPTALYLSVFCGTGQLQAQVMMTLFSAIALDTTVFAYYFFWRAWLVALHRRSGPASFTLHRKAVSAGCFFTMMILVQRPYQFAFITVRKVLLLVADVIPSSWTWIRWVFESVAFTLLDHNVGLSVTTIPLGYSLLMFDGPRSWAARMCLALNEEEAEEMFGSRTPTMAELLFWRLRLPVYLVLRGIVTRAWTSEPTFP